jgi:multidrug efflux system outer membrane protein
MFRQRIYKYIGIVFIAMAYAACKIPALVNKTPNTNVPANYAKSQDTINAAMTQWRSYFTDPYLVALIDTALRNNQELNIMQQEIEISRNEIRARKGEYLPFVGLKGGAGVDKVGRYTNIGASEANVNIAPGRETPDPLPDYGLAANATWEVDIWHKLHNAKKSAVNRYLSTIEGRNFAVTNLVAEIANSYFELLALDNQLDIVKQNIVIQSNALEIVKLQKEAAKTTELAVRKFEAEVLKTRSLQFGIQQGIVETENKINFLLARYPQHIERNDKSFNSLATGAAHSGIPSQLLENRPDVRQAEQLVEAAKLDVKVAKAQFYPSVAISATLGYDAFNPSFLIKTPESIIYSLAGDLVAPLVNRNAIKAMYYNANAKQIQAVYNYERTILNAYTEVANQMANISNLEKSYDLKAQQVQALTESISISNDLFRSARADYMEVLLTQRDALESKFELVETKKQQMNALVNIYHALGGGWK